MTVVALSQSLQLRGQRAELVQVGGERERWPGRRGKWLFQAI